MLVSAAELKLGDTVQLANFNKWGTAIVITVTENYVELWRPYGHLADFSMIGHAHDEKGSAVIPYVGIETFLEHRECDHRRFKVVSRKILK